MNSQTLSDSMVCLRESANPVHESLDHVFFNQSRNTGLFTLMDLPLAFGSKQPQEFPLNTWKGRVSRGACTRLQSANTLLDAKRFYKHWLAVCFCIRTPVTRYSLLFPLLNTICCAWPKHTTGSPHGSLSAGLVCDIH